MDFVQKPYKLYNMHIHSIIVPYYIIIKGFKNQRQTPFFPWTCLRFYKLDKKTLNYEISFVIVFRFS